MTLRFRHIFNVLQLGTILSRNLQNIYTVLAFRQMPSNYQGTNVAQPIPPCLLEEFFLFLIKVYKFVSEENRMKMTDNLYRDVHTYISLLYKNKMASQIPKSKNELLCRNFMQLVVCHYAQTRNVAWYAKKLVFDFGI